MLCEECARRASRAGTASPSMHCEAPQGREACGAGRAGHLWGRTSEPCVSVELYTLQFPSLAFFSILDNIHLPSLKEIKKRI